MGRILLCTADMVVYLNGPLVSAWRVEEWIFPESDAKGMASASTSLASDEDDEESASEEEVAVAVDE
jgi:hypothetical protein